jgi:hypothetical protein
VIQTRLRIEATEVQRLAFLALALLFRTSADFAAAFLALAVRSAGVIVSRLRLPPILPPLAPCFLKNSKTSGGSFRLTCLA